MMTTTQYELKDKMINMKVGLLICSYNRPEYLKQCLESVSKADLSQISEVWIVDDASTDPETRRLIDNFDLPGVELIKVFSKGNRTIKGSLLFGLDFMFASCEVVTNLDGDAIVTRDAFNRLLKLREKFPGHIITGFNCTTKNRNGSIRHKVLEQGDGWNKKYSVGGINMMFSSSEYNSLVRPALLKSLKEGLNWDHQSCIISNSVYGKPIVVLEPSCVQHIGINSSMGHSAGGEPPDVADDFNDPYDGLKHDWVKFDEAGQWGNVERAIENGDVVVRADFMKEVGKINLPNVTLVGADCVHIERLVVAANICERQIKFGDVKLFTSLPTYAEDRIEKIDPIKSKEAYSWFVMKDLPKHIKTSHMLIIQYDGYILNPAAWRDEWLEYDYIGAPWEWYPENQVGNGGFSLRSKRLMDIVASDDGIYPVSDGLNTHKEEDHCICRIYRKYLEETYQIKFAPVEVARQFSIEGWRSKNNTWTNEFGFHGKGLTNIKP